MKPYALTENHLTMINQDDQDRVDSATGEEESIESSYPRELNMRGLLVSLGVSVAVVLLLIIAFA